MSADPVAEFRAAWLPHVSDRGLSRLVELLGKASPLFEPTHRCSSRFPSSGPLDETILISLVF